MTPKPGLPTPKPGEVINCSYLWRREYEAGRDEGLKDRPVAVVIVSRTIDGFDQLFVVPLTTREPLAGEAAIEVPAVVREQLGLSAQRSWVIVSEWNRFTWPGFDIRPTGKPGAGISYGFLPSSLFRRIRDGIVSAAAGRPVDRDQ